jgi:hypothetical protein
LHRYQLQAVGKLIGGLYSDYSVRDGSRTRPKPVDAAEQQAAIDALIGTLEPQVLQLPPDLAGRIPPRPPGFPATRETFGGATGEVFDPLAPAAAATVLTLEVLLNPERAARMNRQPAPRFPALVEAILDATWFSARGGSDELHLQTAALVLDALLRLAVDDTAGDGVKGTALRAIDRLYETAGNTVARDALAAAYLQSARYKIERLRADPSSVAELPEVVVPPGSPIGADGGSPPFFSPGGG